ncbi:ABC transporter permease [Paenibacillus sp. TRM 82003]|uniref:ABC transporter permease n=1 Tax=Kineococcus sp. TRM81007 TaxID=2925831 RepID=UPI001F584B3B|nr:ABC transporter permease [Kineococcus sp. TRM81007]MCI2238398.1 ABC transporter permease [Kineococcus sp. TRM81007]MCI3922089.1 ABC transporter permease [Paenibacillus sp. TRM 82003]
MGRWLLGPVAAVTEAWGEVRVHRTRVVLSLVGVFLAVFAMTTITAAGNMGRQMMLESSERSGGRAATLQVSAYPNGAVTADGADAAARVLRETAERHRVTWWGLVSQGSGQMTVRFPSGAQLVTFSAVDPSYGTMHRALTDQGRFFTAADGEAFSPRLVVNRAFADQLGGFDEQVPPTVVLGGDRPVTATLVGVMEVPYSDPSMPAAYVLNSAAQAWGLVDPSTSGPPSLELWVPDADAEALTAALQTEVQASLPGYSVSAYRTDFGQDLGVVDAILAYGVRGVGVFALVLGGIGVLNVGLVTVRQRIREIGVRRSFGATGGRVFFAVLLESVAATFVAGVAAVALSVLLVSNFPLEAVLPAGVVLQDVPPFPVSAAVEGLLAATAVGALAGIVPATMAVRAKVIDAIRY